MTRVWMPPPFPWMIFAVLVLSPLTGCIETETPERTVIRPVRTVTVDDVDGFKKRGFPGLARAAQEVDLAFRVDGPLIARPVNVGDQVEQGQLVARIDPRDFQTSPTSVEAELTQVRSDLALAEAEYERGIAIQRRGAGLISDSELDQRRAARDRANGNVASLTAAVEAAANRLEDTYLRAPFEGRVVTTFVENFQSVRAKQPIVRILDTSHIEMTVNVSENLIALVPLVRSVKIRFDAFPNREFEGTIKEIGTEASRNTRTFPVTLSMEQPEDISILPGMAGSARPDEVELTEEQQDKGVGVPVGAVFTPDTDKRSHVWVVEPTEDELGMLTLRPVETGDLTRYGVLVTEGLSAGERIVTAGVHSVREGQTVRILREN